MASDRTKLDHLGVVGATVALGHADGRQAAGWLARVLKKMRSVLKGKQNA
jgi:hypothetical protein